jgi:hypothetical protein
MEQPTIIDARRVLFFALRYLKEILEKSAESETRATNVILLTKKDGSKPEAYKALQDYLRGRVSSPPVNKLCEAYGGSLAKAITDLTYISIMDLVGGGYWSGGENENVGEKRARLIELTLDISASLKTSDRPGGRTWLELVMESLDEPMRYFALYILQQELQIEKWKESDGYAEGLKGLGKLVYWTVAHDAWLRASAVPKDAANWHYYNDVRKMKKHHGLLGLGLSKRAIRDDHASYALFISPYFKKRQENTDLDEGFHMWEVGIDSKKLKMDAEKIKQLMEERKITSFHFEKVISDITSGRMKGVASPLRRIVGLWRGWVGSMLRGIAEASEEGNPPQVVYLRMREPPLPFRYYPFHAYEFIRLTANTLAISRQLAHVYSYMGKLFVEKAKRAGDPELAKVIEEKLDPPLYSESPGWASDELWRIPARPLPSIYEQIFHTPTVMVGLAYNVLSSISLALKLDPMIPPDPLDLIELDPVKEEFGEKWSELERPELSESAELLRTLAQIPVGHLERLYNFIEMALELYPIPPALRVSEGA